MTPRQLPVEVGDYGSHVRRRKAEMIDLLFNPLEQGEVLRYLQPVVEVFLARPVRGVGATLVSRTCLDVEAPVEGRYKLDTGFRASWDQFRARTFDARFGRRNSPPCCAWSVPFEQMREDLAAKAAATEQGAVFDGTEDA